MFLNHIIEYSSPSQHSSDMSNVNGTTNKPDGQASTQGNALTEDIALLASLLSDDQSEEIDERNISELLRKLDTANGVASGVEDRLDEILNNLDGLLGTLESSTNSGTSTASADAGSQTNTS